MTPSLTDLERLARQAGDILRANFGRRQTIDHKGIVDLVTEVDRQTEAFLVSQIRRRFPSHRILAEESGGQAGEDCCLWFIDPLDGTVNYAHGVPIFSVSLAFQENEKMRFGVVYDPMQDECFSAEAGRGAWLNGEPIHVSNTSDLDNSLLVTGFPYDIRENPDNNLDYYSRFSLLSQAVRRLGSAALDLSYVACGRFEGFWELRLSPWDVAAGALIVQEAGGLVTNIHGGGDYLSPQQSILASNPYIHALMLAQFNHKK